MVSIPALKFAHLESGYGDAKVISDVSLEIEQGEIFTILGKNGMGKSTLLKTIMGFLKLEKGTVHIGLDNITGKKPYTIARQSISYIQQEQALFQDLTVEENLLLGLPKNIILADGVELIKQHFPIIPQRFQQKAGSLSGGEQRMLLMSRALVASPKIMLIDEISEGLQPTMIERMANVLKIARNELGVSILLIEQNLDFALSVADRYAVLKLGQIVDVGTVSDNQSRTNIKFHLEV